MAVVRYVSFFPPTGFRDRAWDEHPASDALVKTGRRVSELLSEEVARLRLEGPSSEVRVSCALADGPDIEVHVNLEARAFGSAHARVPAAVAALSPQARAQAAFDVLFGALAELARVRGWDLAALEGARRACLERDLEFAWSSPWKASPNRRWEARATFWLEDHGHGGAVLEVRERGVPDAPIERSGAVDSFCTSAGFQRSAKTLRWTGDQVAMLPHIGLFGTVVDGGVTLRPGEGSSDPAWRPPTPTGSGGEVPTTVRFVQRGKWTVPPGIMVVGGTRVPGVERAYGRAIERHFRRLAKEGAGWWEPADRDSLEISYSVRYDYSPPRPRIAVRRLNDRVTAVVRRPESSLTLDNASQLAREDAVDLIAAVSKRMGLGDPPQL